MIIIFNCNIVHNAFLLLFTVIEIDLPEDGTTSTRDSISKCVECRWLISYGLKVYTLKGMRYYGYQVSHIHSYAHIYTVTQKQNGPKKFDKLWKLMHNSSIFFGNMHKSYFCQISETTEPEKFLKLGCVWILCVDN